MEKQVEFEFLIVNGKSEIINFIESLNDKDRGKLLITIDKIEEYGIEVAKKMKWIKKLDKEIFEICSSVGNNIQRCLYFQKVDNIYLITHGFTKKTQKTPKKEIAHAQHLMKQYKER